jgi:NHL repeat
MIGVVMALFLGATGYDAGSSPAAASLGEPPSLTGANRITTVASSGKAGFSGDGGPATAARLDSPAGVAVDSAGNIYIADSSNHRVRKVGTDGAIVTVAGSGRKGFSGDGGPALSARLSFPAGVAVDAQGTVYILDSSNLRVRKVTPDGTISTAAPASDGVFASFAVDASGSLLIAEPLAGRVRKWSPDGKVTTVAGKEGGTRRDGGPAVAAAIEPNSLAVDGRGNLLISDEGRIRRVGSDGTISTVAGSLRETGFKGDGPATGAAVDPGAITVDAQGNVYFVERTDPYRVRKVSPDGRLETIAGRGGVGEGSFGDGGAAVSADVDDPLGLAMDREGNLYIADTNHHAIRKISLSGPAPLGTTGCSLSAARALVAELSLGIPATSEPVGRVICGPFAGPGSHGMVVVLASGREDCLGRIRGWLFFRLDAGKWVLTTDRRHDVLPVASGASRSVLQQARTVRLSGDPRCNPSRALVRTWRWDGATLAAGPWKKTAPEAAPMDSALTFFKTPSRNIVCLAYTTRTTYVQCVIKSGLAPPPPTRCPGGNPNNDRLWIDAIGRTRVADCAGDAGALGYERSAWVLAHGKTLARGGIRCSSAPAGITCRNRDAHGFFLGRGSWRTF